MGWTNIGNELSSYFSFDAKEGTSAMGAYFWTKDFRDFLYSFTDVISNERNWKLNPGYSFKVVDVSSTAILPAFGEFRLPINPSNIQFTEEFATTFKPTQNGMVVEHSGSIFKELVLQGTTGFNPSSGKPKTDELVVYAGSPSTTIERLGSIYADQGVQLISNSVTAFSKKYTGYTWAHLLVNFLRSYVQSKTLPEGKGFILVFDNKRDGEQWQCEVTSLDIHQAAGRPFLYDYRISLRVLKRNVPTTIDTLFDDAIGYINDVSNIIENATTLLEAASNLLSESMQIIYQIEGGFEQLIMRPLNDIITALDNLKTTGAKFPSTQRKWLDEFKSDTKRFETNFYNFIDDNEDIGIIADTPETNVMKAINSIKSAISQMTATNALFASDAADPFITTLVTNNEDIFSSLNTIDISKKRASSKTRIKNAFGGDLDITSPSSTETTVVRSSETLEDISIRTLGTIHRWMDIAIINKMVYPYIDEVQATIDPRVRKAGDIILIPSNRGPIRTSTAKFRENQLTKNMTETEKLMGVDFRLTNTFDFILSNKGDFELCAGVENAAQAINIKIALERGALRYHPQIGVGLVVGLKNIQTVDDILDGIKNSILSDGRFEAINNITVARFNSKYVITMDVKVLNIDNPVPLTLNI